VCAQVTLTRIGLSAVRTFGPLGVKKEKEQPGPNPQVVPGTSKQSLVFFETVYFYFLKQSGPRSLAIEPSLKDKKFDFLVPKK
jgi:hypothetical protein